MKTAPFLIRTGLCGLIALAACGAPAFAQNAPAPASAPAGDKVATVNGEEIPASRLEALVHMRTQQGAPDTPELRKQARDALISQTLVAQAAEKKGFGRDPEVIRQLEAVREQILTQAYLTDYFKQNPISDAAVKAEYDRTQKGISGMEYKASHILVKTEAEAKDMIAKLNSGASFADLAKFSEDPGSKNTGGDLGWASPSTFVKPFADALVKLKKGETTATPVQTQYGYHIIRLNDTRPMKAPPMEQLAPRIRQHLQQEQIEKLVAELRAKAKIE
jgi:peptidyl-prolyl cis-trans isomerase C